MLSLVNRMDSTPNLSTGYRDSVASREGEFRTLFTQTLEIEFLRQGEIKHANALALAKLLQAYFTAIDEAARRRDNYAPKR